MAGTADTERALQEWFRELCNMRRPAWDAAVQAALDVSEGGEKCDIERRLAGNAARDVARLDTELNLMLVRTSILVAAATLLFAVYALKSTLKAPPIFLALALCFAAIAFIAALVPMRPPFVRAWRQPYEKRHNWTLLTTTPFKQWVLDCWLADRRTPVIQMYKKAHAVAVPFLLLAAVWSAIGLTIGLFR